MNRIISPPIKIRNKINENQELFIIVFSIKQIISAWEITLISIKIGGLNKHSIKALKTITTENNGEISNLTIRYFIKMLTLGVRDNTICGVPFDDFIEGSSNYWVTRSIF